LKSAIIRIRISSHIKIDISEVYSL